MTARSAGSLDWKHPIYGLLGALIITLPTIIVGNDIGTFLATAAITLIVVIVIVLMAIFCTTRRRGAAALSMVVVFVAASWLLFKVSSDVRSNGRWIVQARSYKTHIFAQPDPPSGQLKHMEWEGWGFAGAGDTVVYLVFDPSDSLASAAASHLPGKYRGIPCVVPTVRRLESHWYTVLFYTDTSWDYCDSAR
jgi:hypothetical protein